MDSLRAHMADMWSHRTASGQGPSEKDGESKTDGIGPDRVVNDDPDARPVANDDDEDNDDGYDDDFSSSEDDYDYDLDQDTLLQGVESIGRLPMGLSLPRGFSLPYNFSLAGNFVLPQAFSLPQPFSHKFSLSLPQNISLSLPQNMLMSLPHNISLSLPQNLSLSLPQSLSFPQNISLSLPQNLSQTFSQTFSLSPTITLPPQLAQFSLPAVFPQLQHLALPHPYNVFRFLSEYQELYRDDDEVLTAIDPGSPDLGLRSPVVPENVILLTDDEIRDRLKEIRDLNLDPRDRDYRVQRLMTHNYYTITGRQIPQSWPKPGVSADVQMEKDQKDTSLVINKDLTESIRPDGAYGCSHYQRNNKIKCADCGKWYTCRLCHDSSEDHVLPRRRTSRMWCMLCKTEQPAQHACASCHTLMGHYYCGVCKLWDSGPDSIYHCDACGICRIGQGLGVDFFHCDTCGVCMAIALKGSHKCVEKLTECGCPVCNEYMFSSTNPVMFMKCGHPIHEECFTALTRSSYKCPTCARTVVSSAARFRLLDAEIAAAPLPEPYNEWQSEITCNDCTARSLVPFHVIGLKCNNCGSYNTAQLRVVKPDGQAPAQLGVEEAGFVETEADAELGEQAV